MPDSTTRLGGSTASSSAYMAEAVTDKSVAIHKQFARSDSEPNNTSVTR